MYQSTDEVTGPASEDGINNPILKTRFMHHWWVILIEVVLISLILLYAKTMIFKLGLLTLALGFAIASWAFRDFPDIGLRSKNAWWKSVIFGIFSGIGYFLLLAGVQYLSTNYLGRDLIAGNASGGSLINTSAAEILVAVIYFTVISAITIIFTLGYLYNRIDELFRFRHWSLPLVALTGIFGFSYPWTPFNWESYLAGVLVVPYWTGVYLASRKNLWAPMIGFSTTLMLIFMAAFLGY